MPSPNARVNSRPWSWLSHPGHGLRDLTRSVVAARSQLRGDARAIGLMPILAELERCIHACDAHPEADDPLHLRRPEICRHGIEVEAIRKRRGFVMLGERA